MKSTTPAPFGFSTPRKKKNPRWGSAMMLRVSRGDKTVYHSEGSLPNNGKPGRKKEKKREGNQSAPPSLKNPFFREAVL